MVMEYEERQSAGRGNNAKISLLFFDRVLPGLLQPCCFKGTLT